MDGPIILAKDMPAFLAHEVSPILWPVVIPLMLLWLLWMFLYTPIADWNRRENS